MIRLMALAYLSIIATCCILEAQSPRKVHIPPAIADPLWLTDRRAAQLESAGQYEVYHQFSFSDQVEKSGIRFRNQITDESGKHWQPIHYDHGNGVAVADVDGDGWLDLYFTTQSGGNQLWRNLRDGTFEDITQVAGVAVAATISVTASFADIDNDGDPDLYVTVIRDGNRLFENDGTGKFTDISARSGLDYKGHSSGALFFDYNNDGLLDLFLANVGNYTTEVAISAKTYNADSRMDVEYEYYIGLEDAFHGHLKPERTEQSVLFKNSSDNRFVDVSAQSRLQDSSWSGDASALDANEDGWLDLYVLNMQGHDHYYENVQGEYFSDKSREVFPRTPWGAMGVKVFDGDNDGRMDMILTDMHADMSQPIGPEQEKLKADVQYGEDFLLSEGRSIYGNAFYRKTEKGTFVEVSDEVGVENYWPWGLSVGDLNADGYEDVFITSSMNYPFRYGVNSLLLNERGEKFLDSEFVLGVEPRRGNRTAKPWFALDCAGADSEHPRCKDQDGSIEIWGALGSRSSAILDLDGDGDLDIVTNEFNAAPQVLISDLSEKRELRFLKIDLEGTRSNRDGLGAIVKVRADGQSYSKVRDGKSGYLSQSLMPLYFGLGDATVIEQVEVRWLSGHTQTLVGPIETNKLLVIAEE